MSERIAEVIELNLEKCPNSDNLSIQKVEGFQLVVRTEDWKDHKLAVFIRADEIVDTNRPEFSWLKQEGKEKHRVRTRKYLGMYYSHGILVPAPEGSIVGQNLYEELGLEHYEPELEIDGVSFGKSSSVSGPVYWNSLSKYDIENGRSNKYNNMFVENELVYVTRKLHGCFVALTWDGEKLHVKSRNHWKSEGDNVFWNAVNSSPELVEFAKSRPNWLFCGEAYGQVQKGFHYDAAPGTVKIRLFDIRRSDYKYMSSTDFIATCNFYNLPRVPHVGNIPYNFQNLCKIAEDPCPLGCKVSEGIVIKPITERYDERLGRVVIKIVNPYYLSK